ncbi:MAG: AraC family transcriptional regulator, partial [Cyclobacteriaceae bacterium]|nr:AraC family transcriptional regulator [Cyclobacteriaceae bacterium]
MHKSLKSLSLSLLNIDYVSLDSKWDFDNVISPFTRMYYIAEGSARVYHNGSVFSLTKGNMYLIPSYTYSRYKCDDHMNQYHISFFEEIGNGLSIYNYKSFNYEIKATQQDIENFKRLLEINPSRGLSNNDPKVYDNYSTLLSFEKRNDDMTSSVYIETTGILLSLFSKFVGENFSSTHQDSITTQKVIESVH